MTALALPLPAPAVPPVPLPAEAVALLQLDIAQLADAASAVYREVRRGRRVVAIASGAADAAGRLTASLDAIGVHVAEPAFGEALLAEGVTVVPGRDVATCRPATEPRPPLRVALAGCGVVGGGLLPRLLDDPRFEVVAVLVRDPAKRRDIHIPEDLLVSDPGALLARAPDVLVEAISDASTGLALIRAALARGISVASANKQAIAADPDALHALADSSGARLLHSASVGGGAPLIETVRRARAHGPVARIEAVLNGTSNFVLNRLAEGWAFDRALDAARDAGFAEADPSADLGGLDAAAKLAILAWAAAGVRVPVETITRRSLSADAVLPPGRVRQLARLDLATGDIGVRLETVDGDPLFADLPDAFNALRVTTADGRAFTARGRGAGRAPTAESVWADLIDLCEPAPAP